MTKTTLETLQAIQTDLKVKKKRFNDHFKAFYRSAEDIFAALTPLLATHKAVITIQDELIQVGDNTFVKSTAILTTSENNEMTATGHAAISFNKASKLDLAQLTGISTSYARKYALCALFAIDDSEESDSEDVIEPTVNKPSPNLPKVPTLTPKEKACDNALSRLNELLHEGDIHHAKELRAWAIKTERFNEKDALYAQELIDLTQTKTELTQTKKELMDGAP